VWRAAHLLLGELLHVPSKTGADQSKLPGVRCRVHPDGFSWTGVGVLFRPVPDEQLGWAARSPRGLVSRYGGITSAPPSPRPACASRFGIPPASGLIKLGEFTLRGRAGVTSAGKNLYLRIQATTSRPPALPSNQSTPQPQPPHAIEPRAVIIAITRAPLVRLYLGFCPQLALQTEPL
jgi:hypothetical protein